MKKWHFFNGFLSIPLDEVISEVMSAIHSLPGSPTYAAMYTSSHAHLSRPSFEKQEVRRSADEAYRVPRAASQRVVAAAASDDSSGPLCASVSYA